MQVWAVTRAKGKKIPSGGTLVLGREQDCLGGCFDSMAGATGKVDTNSYREYGPQDFFGVMDEMRIWRTVRTQQEIIDVSPCHRLPGTHRHRKAGALPAVQSTVATLTVAH